MVADPYWIVYRHIYVVKKIIVENIPVSYKLEDSNLIAMFRIGRRIPRYEFCWDDDFVCVLCTRREHVM